MVSKILGVDGQPMRRDVAHARTRALSGGPNRAFNEPYDSASMVDPHLENWQPYLGSVDSENIYRDRIVSRIRDIVRNSGWSSGAITRIIDNAIGSSLRPIPAPDYAVLARATGISAFDHTWAREFSKALDASWRTWAEADTYFDVSRTNNFSQTMALAFRHLLIDGDCLARIHWLPKRVGKGRAHYATGIELLDPDRLSNPQLRFDNENMRGGCEVDEHNATTAYFIRKAHQGDWFNAAKSLTWERVDRETKWGRPILVHCFTPDRASQHRGIGGIFTPILTALKMLAKYDQVELDSATISSIFGTYVTSPNKDLVAESLDDGEEGLGLGEYQTERGEFHDQNRIVLGNARIPLLFPGESIESVSATRPTSNFAAFETQVLNCLSSGLGISAAQLSNDFSKTNYSSSRSAMLEAYKTLHRRRHDFAVRFADPILLC